MTLNISHFLHSDHVFLSPLDTFNTNVIHSTICIYSTFKSYLVSDSIEDKNHFFSIYLKKKELHKNWEPPPLTHFYWDRLNYVFWWCQPILHKIEISFHTQHTQHTFPELEKCYQFHFLPQTRECFFFEPHLQWRKLFSEYFVFYFVEISLFILHAIISFIRFKKIILCIKKKKVIVCSIIHIIGKKEEKYITLKGRKKNVAEYLPAIRACGQFPLFSISV